MAIALHSAVGSVVDRWLVNGMLKRSAWEWKAIRFPLRHTYHHFEMQLILIHLDSLLLRTFLQEEGLEIWVQNLAGKRIYEEQTPAMHLGKLKVSQKKGIDIIWMSGKLLTPSGLAHGNAPTASQLHVKYASQRRNNSLNCCHLICVALSQNSSGGYWDSAQISKGFSTVEASMYTAIMRALSQSTVTWSVKHCLCSSSVSLKQIILSKCLMCTAHHLLLTRKSWRCLLVLLRPTEKCAVKLSATVISYAE